AQNRGIAMSFPRFRPDVERFKGIATFRLTHLILGKAISHKLLHRITFRGLSFLTRSLYLEMRRQVQGVH
ncbi:MAG: hypothetical protein R3264_15455, partial [Anaerolineae bacterium]|nr:hypothetical protein [Anaerolineae bacterium]